jgi:hypothetical protein
MRTIKTYSKRAPFYNASTVKLGKPGVQDGHLVRGRFEKGHTHAHSFLNVDNAAEASEGTLVTRDGKPDYCSDGKSVENVEIAAFSANFGNSAGNMDIAYRLNDFHRGNE